MVAHGERSSGTRLSGLSDPGAEGGLECLLFRNFFGMGNEIVAGYDDDAVAVADDRVSRIAHDIAAGHGDSHGAGSNL
jgi:hypothetical protein